MRLVNRMKVMKRNGDETCRDRVGEAGRNHGSALRFHVAVAALAMILLFPLRAQAEPVEFDGLIEPKQVVELGSPVPGILESVNADRGNVVKEGQVLAMLQSGVEKAAMDLARARAEFEGTIQSRKAELEFAIRNQERRRELYEKKALPFQEWDEVETKRIIAELALNEAIESKRIAEMEYKRAQEVYRRMTIRSPLTGVVVERHLFTGEYVEDKPIMKLAQVDPLHVEVVMPVERWGLVKVGVEAAVRPESPVGGLYKAKVTVVDKVVDAASGTFGIRLELPNPDYRLPPGLKCKVIFQK
jgi:RND family efflux transporter MFP subunit